jgi:hypothetical protein
MGKANNKVVKDEHSKKIRRLHTQWWVVVKKGGRNDRKLADPNQWVDISFVLFSFPTRSNVTINSIIMINVNRATKVKQNLDVVNETIKI